MTKTLLIAVLMQLTSILYAQPTLDGSFDGIATWGNPVSISDNAAGWAGVNIGDVHITESGDHIYIGIQLNNAADWQSWGIAINTQGCSTGDQEVWNYPITYGHDENPDAVIKGHFGQGGSPYAELYLWESTAFNRTNNDGIDAALAVTDFYSEETGMIEVRIKKTILNNPFSISVQAYITGNVSTEHAVFDSNPDDQVASSWNDSSTLDEYSDKVTVGGTPQISPIFPTRTDDVTITFDATGTALAGASKVYLHSGVSLTQSDATLFDKAIGNWGQDDGIGEMTSTATDMWEITLSDLETYYGIDMLDDIFGINFLFRSADGGSVADNNGCNYFYAANAEDHFSILNPIETSSFGETGSAINASFFSDSIPISWTLERIDDMGNTLSTIGTAGAIQQFDQSINITTTENYLFKIYAQYNSGIRYKYFNIIGHNPVQELARPSWVQPGINYHDGDPTKVTLVLHAPTYTRYYNYPSGSQTLTGTNTTTERNVVFAIGDFNNWTPSDAYKLYRDRDGWDSATATDSDADGDRGDYFWITLENLTPGQEYIFQYLLDNTLQIADPYADKISDNDDQYISADRYDGILAYPDLAEDRASVFQTDQASYNWTAPSFTKPTENNLNIYELHFRDFTEKGTYLAAIDRLDYLKALGINAIHVLPVSEFEGNSSWGYNPNFYFAPDKYYGTKNDLKKFIDECHQREIQVFNDIVLNHAFYSNAMARMYWNDVDNKPADDNPWFNPDHKMISDQAGWWGADWNHESEHTQNMVDRILDYWIQEYKFDGFRFDFTKGFGQTAQDSGDPWASSYDQNRIDLLIHMASGMKSRNPGTVTIFEHLAWQSEDAVLADSGILMWTGAGHHNDMKEFMLGFNGQDIYTSGTATAQGYTYANLMSYMESHDEERQAYEVMTYGNNVTTTEDMIDRLKIGAVFNLLFPGPRMLWQKEELAYDISIDFNGRTGEKPVKWDYYYDDERKELWRLMSMIFHLRNNYSLYTTAPDYGNVGSSNDISEARRMELNDGNGHYVISIANLDPINSQTVIPGYGVTGTWYRYNGDEAIDGSTLTVVNTSDTYTLAPSESLLLTNFDIAWQDLCDMPGNCCVSRLFTWVGGNDIWNDASNWDRGMIPQSCDIVSIPAGAIATIQMGQIGYCSKVIIETGGDLQVLGELELGK